MILLLSISCLGLLKLARYELRRISTAVGLFKGLNCNKLITKLMASAGVPGLNHSAIGFCLVWLTCSIIVKADSAFSDSTS